MENQNSESNEIFQLYQSFQALSLKVDNNTATPEEIELYKQYGQRLNQLVQAQRQQEEQAQQPQPQRNYRTEVQSADTVIQEPYSPDQPIHLLMLELAKVKAQQANELNWQLTEWAKIRPINAVAVGVALCVLWFGSAAATRGMLSMTTKPSAQEAAK